MFQQRGKIQGMCSLSQYCSDLKILKMFVFFCSMVFYVQSMIFRLQDKVDEIGTLTIILVEYVVYM